MHPVKGAPGRFGVLTPSPYEATGPQTSDPPRAERGVAASGNAYGGGILCENASSPMFRNCVITDCTITGAHGGDGANGQVPLPNWSFQAPDETNVQTSTENQWGGHGNTGQGIGFGGGLAARGGSRPMLIGCTFENNRATGGVGGNGGNAGDLLTAPQGWGGSGGIGIGDGRGGAIYADAASRPIIRDCRFLNNVARTGQGGAPGLAGQGTALADPRGPARDGSVGSAISTGGVAGGAFYYDRGATVDCEGSVFTENTAFEAYMGIDPTLCRSRRSRRLPAVARCIPRRAIPFCSPIASSSKTMAEPSTSRMVPRWMSTIACSKTMIQPAARGSSSAR